MKTPVIIGGLLILLGLLFVGITVLLALRKLLRMKNWTKTTGIVINVQSSQGMRRNQFTGSSGGTVFKPTVRFQAANGQVIDYEPITSNNWSNYSIGQNVTVYYDPRQPANAFAGTTVGLWFGLVVLGLVGGFFALVGTVLFFIGLTSPF